MILTQTDTTPTLGLDDLKTWCEAGYHQIQAIDKE